MASGDEILNQWFDISKRIKKSDLFECLDQMRLYATKGGVSLGSAEHRKELKEMRVRVKNHNKSLDSSLINSK